MRPTVDERIAERTALADNRLPTQGMFARLLNRTGLILANTVDRMTAFADDDRNVFMGATAAGLWRGAAYGVLATVAAVVLLHGITSVIPVLLASMAIGAIAYGVYDGQKHLEDHLNAKNSRTADDIAKLFGAIPGHPFYPTRNPKIVVNQEVNPRPAVIIQEDNGCDFDPVVVKTEANKPVEVTVADDKRPSFATRVDISRAQAATQER